jgi:serine/threonine protein kinase
MKSPNIFLDAKLEPVIGDFGLAKFMTTTKLNVTSVGVGTLLWMAPEVMTSTVATPKADIYALGIILWELLSGQWPFADVNPVQLVPLVLNGTRPAIDSRWPASIVEPMKACWQADPESRPSAEHVVEHLLAQISDKTTSANATPAEKVVSEEISHDDDNINNNGDDETHTAEEEAEQLAAVDAPEEAAVKDVELKG